MIGLPGPELDSPTIQLIRDITPGGICLFSRNIREASQTRELLDGIRELLPFEPILCLDQEGGLVDRLRRIFSPMPEPSEIKTPGDSILHSRIIARAIRLLGFNMTLAPVVDVINDARRSFVNGLTGRNFGTTAREATELAGAFLHTLQAEGCLGCLKHFPGLGAAKVDSHEQLPVVEIDEEEFAATDLVPYRELFSTGSVYAVMVAHAAYPNLGLQENDQNGRLLPSSLSRSVVNGLLREEMGFNGLVISDDLEMGAILNEYGIDQAAVMSLRAGVDMVAVCADPDRIRQGYEAVVNALASGSLEMEAAARSSERTARFRDLLCPPFSFDAAEIADLSSQVDSLRSSLE